MIAVVEVYTGSNGRDLRGLDRAVAQLRLPDMQRADWMSRPSPGCVPGAKRLPAMQRLLVPARLGGGMSPGLTRMYRHIRRPGNVPRTPAGLGCAGT